MRNFGAVALLRVLFSCFWSSFCSELDILRYFMTCRNEFWIIVLLQKYIFLTFSFYLIGYSRGHSIFIS